MAAMQAFEQYRYLWLGIFSIASHHIVFRHIELWPLQLLALISVLFGTNVSLRHSISATPLFPDATKLACIDVAVWTVGITISVGCYRLFLHRLSHFPGPASWALSEFAFVTIDVKGLRPRVVEAAHKKYGDIVRTGPRKISINAASAIALVMGAKSDFWRGSWYVSTAGLVALTFPEIFTRL